jgi:hypothetical protein
MRNEAVLAEALAGDVKPQSLGRTPSVSRYLSPVP